MRRIQLLFFILQFTTLSLKAQWLRPDRDYKQLYPIGEDADLLYKSSYIKSETILFEANPIVRYSFFNNIHKNMLNRNAEKACAFYAVFKPQLRMYTDNSLPVKMPSYKIQLGFQWVKIIKRRDLFTVGMESGHYSNGQSGCAFSELYDDGTVECENVYKTITDKTNLSDMLNRKNGNFSTNLTELILNYRLNKIEGDHNQIERSHSITLGFNLYHDRFWGLFDFGGYSDEDIKIYGRMRYSLGYSFNKLFKKGRWLSISENIEIIQKPHPFVEPIRSVLSVKYYPFPRFKEFGVCGSYIFGHDNYNYRFVDSGSQISFGITWAAFAPAQIVK